MATYTSSSIVFHLRSTIDDSRFVEEFARAGILVKTASQLADVVAALHSPMTSFAKVFALAPAQHGGITLLELLTDMALLEHVKVILVDEEQDINTAIKALRLGAADYFTAGMTTREVASRIEILRNWEAQPDIDPPAIEPPAVVDFPPTASASTPICAPYARATCGSLSARLNGACSSSSFKIAAVWLTLMNWCCAG